MLELLFIFLFGFVIGFFIAVFIYHIKEIGVMRIDTSDPETDKYMLIVTGDIDNIKKYKKVSFRIEAKNTMSNIGT